MDFPGEKILLKLWETVAEKGIGGLLKPWQMRREGRASIDLKREEMIRLAEADLIVEKIWKGELSLKNERGEPLLLRSFTDSLSLSGTSSNPTSLANLQLEAKQLDIAETLRRDINVTRALLHAEGEVEGDASAPSPEAVDPDWLYRWRDTVSQVSNQELQSLWGKVLAGEIKTPGSCSLRTIDFLRNLSQQEAKEIELLSKFVIGDCVVKDAENVLEVSGVNFNLLLKMQELGVLSGVDALGLMLSLESNDPSRYFQTLKSHAMVLVCVGENSSQKVELPAYSLTEVGKQVVKLGRFSAQISYLKSVGRQLKAQGVKVTLAQFRDVDKNRFEYFSGETL